MKKVVRMLGLCALVALAISACNKKEGVTFTASLTQPESSTRTHGESSNYRYYLVWDNNDEITVVNPSGTASRNFVLDYVHYNKKQATFFVDDAEDMAFLHYFTEGVYYAFYPNAVYNSTTQKVTMQIKQEQELVGGLTFANNSYPMYGNDSIKSTHFVFDSNIGFLVLQLTGPQFEPDGTNGTERYFTKVVLRSKDGAQIAGEVSYNYDGTGYEFNGTCDSIVNTSGAPQPIQTHWGENAEATFILPPIELDGFEVIVYNGDTRVVRVETDANIVIEARKYKVMDPPIIIP